VGVLKTVIALIGMKDQKSHNDSTALIRAVRGGHYDIVRWLLNCGVDVNARDSAGWTALTIANQIGYIHTDIAELLFSWDATQNVREVKIV